MPDFVNMRASQTCEQEISFTSAPASIISRCDFARKLSFSQKNDPNKEDKIPAATTRWMGIQCDVKVWMCHCCLFDRNRTVLGILGKDGTFAQYITLPINNLYVVPDEVSTRKAVFTGGFPLLFQLNRCLCLPSILNEAEKQQILLENSRPGVDISLKMKNGFPRFKLYCSLSSFWILF